MEYLKKFIKAGWSKSRIAQMLNLKDTGTIDRWLKGQRKLEGPAVPLLKMAWNHPELTHELID